MSEMELIVKWYIRSQPDNKITYEQFMEKVLYHPQQGYYRKEKVKVGKTGDFYTSPSVHPVFGCVFARVFADIIQKENLPAVICEIGGGDGRFAQAVLDEWRYISDQKLTYIMVESSPYHRQQQNQRLPVGTRVVQYDTLEQLQAVDPSFCGIVFTNELLDAFPVRVVEKQDGQIDEVFVTLNENDELVEVQQRCTDDQVMDWLVTYGCPLNNGQRIEVPLAMTSWLKNTAKWIEKGALFTVDYGYKKEEWQAPERKTGSLRGYYNHQLITNPLLHPGEMDLTAHIHLDAVREIGSNLGFAHLMTLQQSRFLLAAGILNDLQDHHDPNPFSEVSKQNRAVKSLITDGSIGSYFHVIMQGKNLTCGGEYGIHEGMKQWGIRNEKGR
jgi:SAM-dependent MidA family methyltransferase